MDALKSLAQSKLRDVSRLKDRALGTSEIEIKIKEATNDASWGPTGQQLQVGPSVSPMPKDSEFSQFLSRRKLLRRAMFTSRNRAS